VFGDSKFQIPTIICGLSKNLGKKKSQQKKKQEKKKRKEREKKNRKNRKRVQRKEEKIILVDYNIYKVQIVQVLAKTKQNEKIKMYVTAFPGKYR
jgi:TPP-dependent 2-oxoacid decarboxylase